LKSGCSVIIVVVHFGVASIAIRLSFEQDVGMWDMPILPLQPKVFWRDRPMSLPIFWD